MQLLRNHLARLACVWLLTQGVMLSISSAALCAGMRGAVGVIECTCDHDDGQTCPMHHTTTASKTKSCSCRGTDDGAAAVMASLFGPAAVLTVSINPVEPPADSRNPQRADSRPLDSSLVPDAPPPRA
jgi:hypothetical protein